MASEGQYFGGNVSLLGKLGVGTLTPTEKIDVVGGDISLDDSSKLKLGAGDDLQIYHDGTNSYIDNSSTYLILEGDNIILRNNAGNEDYAKFFGDGACELYFNNSKKFETSSTGATVTGKLVVSGDLDVDGTTTTFNSTVMTVDDPVFGIGGDTAPGSSDNKDRGVSFRYFLSGGSAKVGFFGFDNSANAFTFLTETNDDSTEVFSGTVGNLNVGNVLHGDGSAAAPTISFSSDTNTGIFRADADKLGFSVGGSEKMRLTSSGLGVGTTSPNFLIDCEGAGGGLRVYNTTADGDTEIHIRNTGTTAEGRILFGDSGDTDIGKIVYDHDGDDLIFTTNATEAARFDSNGLFTALGGIKISQGTPELELYDSSSSTSGNIKVDGVDMSIINGGNDGDLILECDNGSNGVTQYLRLDGDEEKVIFSKPITVGANTDGHDVKFFGNSDGFYIEWDESGNILTGYYDQRIATNRELKFGTSTDFLRLYTIGSGGSYIKAHSTADLNIWHEGTDKDIIFKVRNSSSVNEVLRLDGSASSVKIPDSVNLQIGADSDLLIAHAGTNSTITQNTGNLITSAYGGDLIFQTQHTNGTDIIFNTKYSSTTTELLRLDGSASSINVPDDVKLRFGDGNDFQIEHTADANYVSANAGDFHIRNVAQDKDIIITTNDGGVIGEFARIDGSTSRLGIGTTAPDAILDIRGGNEQHLYIQGSNDVGFLARLKTIANGSVLLLETGGTSDSRDILKAVNSSGTVFNLQADGKLCLGAETPSQLLDIHTSSNDEGIRIYCTPNTRTAAELLVDNVGNGNADFRLYNSTVINTRIRSNSGEATYFNAGDVGIGNTSPASKLHVTGTVQVGVDDTGHDVKFFGATSGRYIQWDESANILTGYYDQRIGVSRELKFGLTDASLDYLRIYTVGAGGSYIKSHSSDLTIQCEKTDGNIYFQNDNGSGGETDYFIIDGGNLRTTVYKDFRFNDDIKLNIGTGNDLQIYHSGTTSYIKSTSDDLRLTNASNDNIFRINGDVAELYYNDAKKLETTTDGILLSGNGYIDLPDNGRARFGAGYDLAIYHDGGNSYISDLGTGGLKVLTSSFYLRNPADQDMIYAASGGEVNLYHNNVKKFETTSAGATVTGSLTVSSDLIISGTTTTIDTANLLVEDKNIILGNVSSPSDTTADGGGITLKGASDYTINWTNSTDSWVFNQGITVGANFAELVTNGGFDADTNWTKQSGWSIGSGVASSDGTQSLPAELYQSSIVTIGKTYTITYTVTARTAGSIQAKCGANAGTYRSAAGTYTEVLTATNSTVSFNANADFVGSIDNVSVYEASHDVKFHGATADRYMLWDESANALILPDHAQFRVGSGHDLRMYHTGDSYLRNYTGSLNIENEGNDQDIIFKATTSSTPYEIMRLDGSSGNVGIGTTSPTSKLTVDGTGRFTGHLDVASSSDITGPLRVYNGLGVGGSAWVNPSTALEVSSSGANGLDISEDAAQSNTSGRLFFSNDTSSQGVAIMNTLGSLKFQTGAVPNSTSGTTRMTLSSGGLGTTVPITVGVDDTGHDVKFFGDTSGRYVEWDASADSLEFTDNARVKFGDGNDFQFWHSGSHSYVDNAVGDLYIVNNTDNGDITFQCDNGSGGVETYFFLDGSLSSGSPYTIFPDGANLALGTSADCTLYHNGSHTYISNVTGSLIIQNLANDQDIVFECDDGNGGNATYFYLDGSAAEYSSGSTDALLTRFPDASKIALGSGADMTLFHNGTDSYITNGTGDLRIYNAADDKDIVFQSDDGSGGIETYFFLDGSYADGSYTYTRWNDGGVIALGDARDLRLWHDPNTNSSYIRNSTNDLIIENLADDKDIIFQSDDGSGGVTAYLTLDGSTTYIKMHKHLFMDDSKKVLCGTDGDLELYHDGTNGLLKENTGDLTIMNGAADKDIIFQCDDGSGGEETYFFLDGSLSGGDPVTIFPDDSYLGFGADSDLNIHHNGVDSKLRNQTGNLVIEQNANDKDIVFKCDDGSGGTTEYFYLDGSAGNILFGKEIRLLDGVQLQLGTGNDMQLTHNGANGFITNNTGDLTIKNNADDKDIIFQCDDGSGGVETYFYLDGSLSGGSPYTIFPDHSHLTFGNETDLQIVHNGSHSYIDNYTGTLHIRNAANDGRVRFQCDDGAGGLATYFDLEGGQAAHNGSATTMLMTSWYDNSRVTFGDSYDLQIWHGGTDSYINNSTGDLVITQEADDKDIVFKCDDGSGGTETYFFLDGSASSGNPRTIFPDNSTLNFGDSMDLRILHDGSHSYIINTSNDCDMYFRQDGADRDMVFQCDNGSGGEETYFYLDGSLSGGSPITVFPDEAYLAFGSATDFTIRHTGADTYLSNDTGDLYIRSDANDKDIIFQCDDGSGGMATYFKLDGSYTNGIDGQTYTPTTLFPDHALLALGTHRDLMLWYNNVRGRIAYTGGNEFQISALNNFMIGFNDADGVYGETAIVCYKDGAIKMRHDNSQKFETLTDGIKVTGALALSETTEPTATADVGKIYTKSDNKLYFQDGGGTEHEIAFA